MPSGIAPFQFGKDLSIKMIHPSQSPLDGSIADIIPIATIFWTIAVLRPRVNALDIQKECRLEIQHGLDGPFPADDNFSTSKWAG